MVARMDGNPVARLSAAATVIASDRHVPTIAIVIKSTMQVVVINVIENTLAKTEHVAPTKQYFVL